MIGIRKPAFGLLVIGGVVFASIMAFLFQAGWVAQVAEPYTYGMNTYADEAFTQELSAENITVSKGGYVFMNSTIGSGGKELNTTLILVCGIDAEAFPLDEGEIEVFSKHNIGDAWGAFPMEISGVSQVGTHEISLWALNPTDKRFFKIHLHPASNAQELNCNMTYALMN